MRVTRFTNLMDKRSAGITLIETVLSLLIISGAIVASLNTIAGARASQAVAAQQRLGLVLAEDMLAEVLSAEQYKEGLLFGPEADEAVSLNRSLFDDIDDFHGWSSTPPVDPSGKAVAGTAGYTRKVEVVYAQLGNLESNSATDQGVVRVIVTVLFGSKEVAKLTAYRSDIYHRPGVGY